MGNCDKKIAVTNQEIQHNMPHRAQTVLANQAVHQSTPLTPRKFDVKINNHEVILKCDQNNVFTDKLLEISLLSLFSGACNQDKLKILKELAENQQIQQQVPVQVFSDLSLLIELKHHSLTSLRPLCNFLKRFAHCLGQLTLNLSSNMIESSDLWLSSGSNKSDYRSEEMAWFPVLQTLKIDLSSNSRIRSLDGLFRQLQFMPQLARLSINIDGNLKSSMDEIDQIKSLKKLEYLELNLRMNRIDDHNFYNLIYVIQGCENLKSFSLNLALNGVQEGQCIGNLLSQTRSKNLSEIKLDLYFNTAKQQTIEGYERAFQNYRHQHIFEVVKHTAYSHTIEKALAESGTFLRPFETFYDLTDGF